MALHYLYLAGEPIESPLRIGKTKGETIVLLLVRTLIRTALPREIELQFIGRRSVLFTNASFYPVRRVVNEPLVT